ncbi:MAG: HAMP domain-containing histidine kinase [Candidatus Bathyarchaeota archaeon]|nr:HAMP domain-containing histidine kinase [Candidatus Bathyarchaeota archaeon]
MANAAFYLKRRVNPQTTDGEMIRLIQEDVRYSDKIVNDLLDYSRDFKLELQAASPKYLLMKTLSIVNVPARIRLVDETKDEPPVKVDVDSIIRVFSNVISNAVDAMPNKGVLTVSCQVERAMACFKFVDTGEGMTKETLQKLFQPLFTTKAKGMGFGLSICKRIVDLHGGKIVVESKEGQGTTFSVYLPIPDIT